MEKCRCLDPIPYSNKKPHINKGVPKQLGYGESNLPRGNFILHVNKAHNGVAPPSSQLNCPPWIDGIIYLDEVVEAIYSRTQEVLSQDLNNT